MVLFCQTGCLQIRIEVGLQAHVSSGWGNPINGFNDRSTDRQTDC